MERTPNLKLKKPDGTDVVDITDLNENADLLDKAVAQKATTTQDGRMSKDDKQKLDGIAEDANKYVHPATHPATMITQDSTHRFVTDTEKAKWDRAVTNAKNYTGWIKPTLYNGWSDRNIGDDAPSGYMRDSQGFVHMRGIITGGRVSSRAFWLPKGYCPSYTMQLMAISGGIQAIMVSYITVNPSGSVYVNAEAGNSWLSLDNISFLAEQ